MSCWDGFYWGTEGNTFTPNEHGLMDWIPRETQEEGIEGEQCIIFAFEITLMIKEK